MSDQWELCTFQNNNVVFLKPGEWKITSFKEIAPKKLGNQSLKEKFLDVPPEKLFDVISVLLEQGWELFSIGSGGYWFRRKVQ